MAADATFQYTPLAQSTDIRLAILEGGSGNDSIQFRLVDIEQDKIPPYEALSYEWGSPSIHDVEIYVNRLSFHVRKNLYDALMYLRKGNDRYLWIDALCINQDDVTERNYQVNQMGRIYGQAEQVLVWLGPAGNSSDLAITIFEEMNHFMISGGERGPHLQRMGQWIYMKGSNASNMSVEQPEPELRAILAWAERSFWHRIWIVQEIQLAKRVSFHSGAKCISDSAVMQSRMYLDMRYPDHLHDPLHFHADIVKRIKESLAFVLLMRRKEGRINRRKSTLKDWLYMCKNSLCTDPRDKVYGLLGLATDCQCDELQLDYSKSLHDVYMDVLRLYSERRTDEDDLLNFCHFLNVNIDPERLLGPLHQMPLDKRTVWLRGIFSGIITRKMGPCRKRHSREEVTPKNISSPPESRLNALEPESNLTIEDSKIALLVYGPFGPRIRDVEIDPPCNKIINPLQHLLDDSSPVTYAKHSFMSWGTTEPSGVVHWFTSRPSNYKNDIEVGDEDPAKAHHRGYSGFAPSHAEVGDVTCTFPGSNIALVFREGIGCWKLIGRALTVNPFHISRREANAVWRGDPNRPLSVSFGSRNAVYMRLELATLWKLSASLGSAN